VESWLAKHNSGATISIRGGRPWTVCHAESFATEEEALQREKFLKSGQGREEMTGTSPLFLAKCHNC
jgi:putative endonuclease